MALHCPECGFVNADGANYCARCGAFLAPTDSGTGGPATARMEQEVIADLAAMFGYQQHLGHLTSSGTTATSVVVNVQLAKIWRYGVKSRAYGIRV